MSLCVILIIVLVSVFIGLPILSLIGLIIFRIIIGIEIRSMVSDKKFPKNKILLKKQLKKSEKYLYLIKSKKDYYLIIADTDFKNKIDEKKWNWLNEYYHYENLEQAKKRFYGYK